MAYCDVSINVAFAARGPDPLPPYQLYQKNELREGNLDKSSVLRKSDISLHKLLS